MMLHALPFASALAEISATPDSLPPLLTSLFVVFAALGVIWLLLECTGAIFRMLAERAKRKARANRPVVPTTEEISPEIIAVITAAAYATLPGIDHIVSITPAGPGQGQNLMLIAWASEGRRQHFASHKVR